MGLINLHYEEGQTPIDEEEKEGLLLPSVTTKAELDEVEQRNIEEAIIWIISRRRRFTTDEVLTEQFVKDLHRRMFGSVWKWAGAFRSTNKNIGVDSYKVGIELRMLLDDCRYWITNGTYLPDEIAIRFKARIVAIHCFSNGNGRHSRLIADILIEKVLKQKIFTWSGSNLVESGSVRSEYLKAIKEADKGSYEPLLKFARS